MQFSRWLFRLCGIYGLLILLPQYFMEQQIGQDFPPAITHPENFYGFIGVALAWQVAFLIISLDPARYRLLIIPGILEKLGFGVAVFILLAQQRVAPMLGIFAGIDLAMALAFLIAFFKLSGQDHGGTMNA